MSKASSAASFTRLEVPLVKEGLGTDTVWFGGGRLGVCVAAHGGIERIVYYGRQSIGRASFFTNDTRSAYAKLFKVYLLVEGKAYRMELNQTRLYPGGYSSRFIVPESGIEVEHDLILVSDAIHQTVRVIRNSKKKPLRLRISWHEYTRVNTGGRAWGEWEDKLAPNTWAREIVDKPPPQKKPAEVPWHGIISTESRASTWFGLVSEKPMTTRLTYTGRRFFETGAFRAGSVTVAALFGHDKSDFLMRAEAIRQKGSKESRAMISEWDKRLEVLPRVKLGMPTVESFFRLSPLILEALMPADLPGGMRASVGSYWVWGWDTLVHCEAYLAAGQHRFLRDALELYHRTAHPAHGVGHQFGTEMELKIPQAPAAQGLYTYALYQYVAYTGDTGVLAKHYSLVLRILELALTSGHREGLFEGRALFPDHPEFAGHNGHDISVFNNSIFYQAARVAEHLAGWMDDPAAAKKSRDVWQGLGKSFHRFWDSKRDYWLDSIDIRDWSPRRSYPSHALLSFSPFAQELMRGREAACSHFMAENLVFSGGVRMYPLWDSSFNGDGNQLGQQYQVNDLFFVKTQAHAGRQDLLKKWLGWLDQFWSQNTVPEGVTIEAENEGPLLPDCPGGKQPFSAKAWYMGILNAILGIHFDAGGATVGPGLDQTVLVDGIYFAGARWTFRTQGKGRHILSLRVNGIEIAGTGKIPADVVKSKTIRVEIKRSAKPLARPQLLSADGARLSKWQSHKAGFQAQLEFPGSVFVRYAARRKPRVTWLGQSIPTEYDKRTGLGQIFLASETYQPVGGILHLESI